MTVSSATSVSDTVNTEKHTGLNSSVTHACRVVFEILQFTLLTLLPVGHGNYYGLADGRASLQVAQLNTICYYGNDLLTSRAHHLLNGSVDGVSGNHLLCGYH